MKFLLHSFLLIISINTYSQKSYWVTYTRQDQYAFTFDGTPVSNPDFTFNLVFNDSVSFTFITKSSDQQWKNYCRKGAWEVKHHSAFYNRYTNDVYHGVAYPDPSHPYFIHDSLPINPIHIDSSIKQFISLRVREAYTIPSPGDTIFALLAIDYPYPFGPMNHTYFPYLQLELYDTKTKFHMLANKIKEGDYKIFIPARIPVLTWDEHNKRLKK